MSFTTRPSSRVGKCATHMRTCSFTRSYIHFPRLLVELFSPHLLIRGVVEPCSAKSIVGLWLSHLFWHIVDLQAAAGSVLDSVPR